MKIPIINKSLQLRNTQFYPTVHEKTQIFLHHTAGLNARGAIDWWNQTPEHVGTAYVIDRDGTIYEAFDPMKWGYHLGIKGDDDYCEKHSIGIELVAGGHLVKAEKKYLFCPLFPKLLASREIPEIDTLTLPSPGWRTWEVYHRYTDAQVDSTISLIHYLSQTYGIKLQSELGEFWQYNEKVITDKLPGLWSHSTVRKDKDDIYPEPKLLSALQDYFKEHWSPDIITPSPIPSPQESESDPKPFKRKRNK